MADVPRAVLVTETGGLTGYCGYQKGHKCKACGSSVNAPSGELHGGVIESYTNIILEHCHCSKPPSGEF